jgi:hypothetical protein
VLQVQVAVTGVFLFCRAAIGKLGGWMAMSLDKPEEKAKAIEMMLHRIVCANWLWAFAEQPLTVESAARSRDRATRD